MKPGLCVARWVQDLLPPPFSQRRNPSKSLSFPHLGGGRQADANAFGAKFANFGNSKFVENFSLLRTRDANVSKRNDGIRIYNVSFFPWKLCFYLPPT